MRTPVAFAIVTALGSVALVLLANASALHAWFAADDFLWETGWEGHRGDLGLRLQDHWALHGIAQFQRFKDAPVVADRDNWLHRYRIELRLRY